MSNTKTHSPVHPATHHVQSMNKDALLATLIGFGIGLFITGMFLLGPTIIKSIPKITFPKISLPQKNPKSPTTPAPEPVKQFVTIDSPLAEAIESKKELLVSGTANPGSTILVQGLTDEEVAGVKDDGKYVGNITLLEGKNEITVTSYLDGKPVTQTVTVFFTEENF